MGVTDSLVIVAGYFVNCVGLYLVVKKSAKVRQGRRRSEKVGWLIVYRATQRQRALIFQPCPPSPLPQCLDFTITLLLFHLLLTIIYTAELPKSWEWWIVNVVGGLVMVLGGEWVCSRAELRDIPSLLG